MATRKEIERARRSYHPKRTEGWVKPIKAKEISLGSMIEKKYQKYRKRF